MGRYDKIRVWNGSSWIQPSQMRIWNGSGWTDLGANDSSNTTSFNVWNGSSWVRKTLNRQVNYGDKEWYVSSSGSGGWMAAADIGANVNQNWFNFYFYCLKDYDNDKWVAYYGDDNYGWKLLWLADGRLRWNTCFEKGTTYSYTSNYRKSYTWSVANAYRNGGSGNGTLNFGGTTTSINCGWRHQAWRDLVVGGWGMAYRDCIRIYGITSGGAYSDTYSYINNLTVGSGKAQQTGVLRVNANNTISQDTSISWV